MKTVQYPVRLARSTPETLAKLHEAVAKNPHSEPLRHALADAIQSAGDEGFDQHIRSFYGYHPGLFRNGSYAPYAENEADVIRNNKPDPRHTAHGVMGDLSWFPTAQEANNMAHHEVHFHNGYTLAPVTRGGWTVMHTPDEFDDERDEDNELPGLDDEDFDNRYEDEDPNQYDDRVHMSRVKYAAQERPQRRSPQEIEASFLEAIAKNPNSEPLRHAYADLLTSQGRHGESLFHQNGGFDDDEPISTWNPTWQNRKFGTHYSVSHVPNPETTAPRGVLISMERWPEGSPSSYLIQKDFSIPEAVNVVKELQKQGVKHIGNFTDEPMKRLMEQGGEEPVRHAAYRAPKGGAVVRGSFYQGGKLIPDLEGDFANPPATEQPVAPQYPAPKPKRSIRDRLKAKMKPQPLVVSYARSTPDTLKKLIQEAHHGIQMGRPNPALHEAIADALTTVGRQKEADLVRTGRFNVDLNGGGRIVPTQRVPRINVTRQTRGIPYDQLHDQLGNRGLVRTGNNREIRGGENGDIHILLHGNHVVTAHPNGEYSLFTQNYHTPTTFQVHRQITGDSPNRVRGQTMFRGQPFVEGVRFNPNG